MTPIFERTRIHQAQFVNPSGICGSQNQQSVPSDILPFVSALDSEFTGQLDIDWAVFAFGKGETDCLLKSVELGGKVRVGFENNMLNRDGSQAAGNAERVQEFVEAINMQGMS